tara:strand:+ start:685 stop:1113 length:429 start_codon:yes stop_codon:yes gene_type:complete
MPSLKAKLEQALAVVAATMTSPPAIYYGADSDEQERPCIVCQVMPGREEPSGLGNYFVLFKVTVKSNADIQTTENPVNDHDTRVSNLMAAMNRDDLEALLTAAVAGFSVMMVRSRQLEPDEQGRSFTDSFTGEAYCCPCDFT